MLLLTWFVTVQSLKKACSMSLLFLSYQGSSHKETPFYSQVIPVKQL